VLKACDACAEMGQLLRSVLVKNPHLNFTR